MDFRIDRDLQVPIWVQIKGVIEYSIACGELQVGQSIPSVRELAESFGVAPMTISLVFRELKKDGLIEARPGAGTFVADSSQARLAAQPVMASFHRQVDDLIDRALELGMRPADVEALIGARLTRRANAGRQVNIVMVGLFAEATASYAKSIAAQLGSSAVVEPATLAEIENDEGVRQRSATADLVLTFANTHREVAALLPVAKVVSIRFIPSEATRLALASLDPLARIALVSRFHDFLPILKSGVQRFAAHVENLTTANLDDPDLGDLLKVADVVIFSTGAEQVRALAPASARVLEYRHSPDPGDIERLVVPFVNQTIAEINGRRTPADTAPSKEAS